MINNFNNGCNNCKHFDKTILEAPCNNCFDLSGNNSHWERDTTLKPENLDVASFYPDFCTKSMNKPILHHSDNIDALRYSMHLNYEREIAELMADFNKKENKDMKKQQRRRDRNIIKVKDLETRKIKEVMFNGPATIIKWDPTWIQFSHDIVGDKTVTVCKEPDKLDKTTGFLLAVLKEILDNKSYGNILEKIDEINKENKE